jgi:hypothetical protein
MQEPAQEPAPEVPEVPEVPEAPVSLPVPPAPGREAAAAPVPDPLDEVLTLSEAAVLSKLAAHTLCQQAERGRLRARKVGHTWITTRHWLAVYLGEHARSRRGGDPGSLGDPGGAVAEGKTKSPK